MDSALVLTLFGSAIGFLGAVAGGTLVALMQHRRHVRVDVLTGDLSLIAFKGPGFESSGVTELVSRVVVAALALGRVEQTAAGRLLAADELRRKLRPFPGVVEEAWSEDHRNDAETYWRTQEQFEAALADLRRALADRVKLVRSLSPEERKALKLRP